tara:strand:- start:635 stop:1159 length:525 start_codon:yes stop_codon:yes gene_type:complete
MSNLDQIEQYDSDASTTEDLSPENESDTTNCESTNTIHIPSSSLIIDGKINRDYLKKDYHENQSVIKGISEYLVNLSSIIKAQDKDIKLLKNEKKYVSQRFIPFLKKINIKDINVSNKGNIRKRENERLEPITKDLIFKCIIEFYGEETFSDFMELLNTSRKTKTSSTLFIKVK